MRTMPPGLAAGLFLALSGTGLFGQSYSIDPHSIAGGGGTSTGGVFAVNGTIGQPDAGAMSGGSFSLLGGYWSVTALLTTGAPLLSVSRTPTNTVLISWPSPSAGFVLQQKNDLSPGPWGTPAEPVTNNGTNKFIVVQPPVGNRFYRLIAP